MLMIPPLTRLYTRYCTQLKGNWQALSAASGGVGTFDPALGGWPSRGTAMTSVSFPGSPGVVASGGRGSGRIDDPGCVRESGT